MSGSRENLGLSAEDIAAIKSHLTSVYKSISPVDFKLSKQTNAEIVKVVHSCRSSIKEEKELLDLAYMLATDAAWFYFRKEAKNFLDAHRTQLDDLYQEFFLLIQNELPDYNPEYDIITFLQPRVKKTFSDTKVKGVGANISKHYQDAGVKIRHAERELAKIGNSNPSPEDIHEYLAGTEKKEISITTILRYRDMNPQYLPIDLTKSAVLGGEKIRGPEEEYIEEEERKRFYEVKDKLSPKFRMIIDIQLEYENKYGEFPTIETLCLIMKERSGHDYTEKRVSNLVTAANQQFGRYYKRYKKRRETPVNRIRFDDIMIRQEDEDIINAVNEDINVIDI